MMGGVLLSPAFRAVLMVATAIVFVQALTQQDGCTPDELQCKDGSCVSLSKRCNFVEDCPYLDNTDEDGCVPVICTFDDGLCGWTIEASDAPASRRRNLTENDPSFTWELSQGSSSVQPPLQQYKPDADLTTHKPSGFYVYASSKGGNVDASTNLATKFNFGETSKLCRLTFWYWWSGPDPGFLHVMVRPSVGEPYEVWMTDGNHGNTWQLAEMALGDLNQSAVSIEATRGQDYEGGGAVDGISFETCRPPSPPPDGHNCGEYDFYQCADGNCCRKEYVCDYSHDCFDSSDEQSQVCKTYMFRCNFEDGFSKDWGQDKDDDTEWVLMQGFSGEGLDSLPHVDHTLGSGAGHYVMMDVKVITDPEMVSRLHSPVIIGSVARCQLRFWYMATGTTRGTLRIYRRVSYSSGGLVLLENVKIFGKNVWFVSIVTVDTEHPTGKDYQVVIEGVSPAGRDGFIVLDDLSMTPACERSSNQNLPGDNGTTTSAPFCFPGQLTCNNGQCYNPIEACNFMDDCGDNSDEESCSKSCTFEGEDLCEWFEGSGSSAPWTRIGFPAEPPGPPSDHYHETSTHALGSMTDGTPGKVAILESLSFSTVHDECALTFYHYLNGTDSKGASLSLYRKAEKDVADGYGAELLWQQPSYTAEWKSENIKIGNKRNFILYFQAVHGDGKSYIALDDLAFTDCVQTEECHSTLDFKCADGSCVPYQYACDAKYDCPDKSDEYQCEKLQGNCDFDETDWTAMCGWVQSDEDDKDWAIASSSPDPKLGPAHDHALASIGYYIYMDSQDEPPGKIATVSMGEQYPASEGICYVRFWYYMHNDDSTANTGTFRLVREVKNGYRYPVLTRSGNYEKEWRQEVVLVSSVSPFYLLFEAETGDPFQTYIALDDVSVTHSCVSGFLPPSSNTTCEIDERACANGECVPADFFCDCVPDCKDGSDEGNCFSVSCKTTATRHPTTTVTPTPSPCSDTQFFCNDESSTCVPGLLVCDGVQDCSNGADEKGCPAQKCGPNFVYCGDKFMQDPCMNVDNLCNRQIFCQTYHADESLCGICPADYCRNSGKCIVSGSRLPNCSCTSRYEGQRCERYVGPDSGSTLSGGQIAGIVVGSLLVVVIAGALGFLVYRRQWSRKRAPA